jgi:hypothetical protein
MEFQTRGGVVTRESLKAMIGMGSFLAGYWKTADAAALEVRRRYHITDRNQWLAL